MQGTKLFPASNEKNSNPVQVLSLCVYNEQDRIILCVKQEKQKGSITM